ncbi:MAG: nucleoside-diphosphate kinase [Planctomycetes bacterium]|nr:nucleoside-diphosphate kinase [Planctomycetota bacterium]
MEKTLLLIKPDAVRRGLVGRITARLEDKGLVIEGMRMFRFSRERAEEFYSVHRGKEFYGPLVTFMSSGPTVAVAAAGKDAVSVVRKLVGATEGSKAEPGTIRGDFGLSNRYNLVHASDSRESYEKEVAVVLRDDDIIERDAGADVCFPEELQRGREEERT